MKTSKVIPINALSYDVFSPFQKCNAATGLKSRSDAKLWIEKFKAHCWDLKKQAFPYPLIVKARLSI